MIVRVVPDNGQTDVDAALDRLLVEFDQDMDPRGFSWTGGGPSFPKMRGQPTWLSPRVCILPVQLRAGREYTFGINSTSYRNFRNAAGEPVEPYSVTFRTAGTGSQRARTPTVEENRRSIAELERAVRERYSYRDLRKVDWPARFADHKPALEQAETVDSFARAAARVLAAAEDPHIWLVADGITIGTMQRQVRANYNLEAVERLVPGWKKVNDAIATGRFDNDIGYLLIKTWDRQRSRELRELDALLTDMAVGSTALIVDVRPNSGGDEELAQEFAARFVAQPLVYAKHAPVDPARPGGFAERRDSVLVPSSGSKYRGPVAVLMGPQNMSSCEAFLLMMKQAPRCKLIGERSYGSSGNPQPNPLANGVTVYLPSWQAFTADGEWLEGKGIAPDIEVPTGSAEFQRADSVLAAALQWLRDETR